MTDKKTCPETVDQHDQELQGSGISANTPREAAKTIVRSAKFALGDQVRHRIFAFRGVVLDIDFTFDHTEEWYNAIPVEMRPSKDQPFYHLLAEKEDKSTYFAYVSEQNLLRDTNTDAIEAPEMKMLFNGNENEGWKPRRTLH